MPFPTLARAPIREAIIDVRVDAPNLTLDRLEVVHARVSDMFPLKKERMTLHAEIGIDPTSTTTTRTVLGWVATAPDETCVMQARIDGFTYARLAPYSNWVDLRDRARQLWDIYASTTAPNSVTRLGVRFINRIELPKDLKDFADYLLTFPHVGPTLPQSISGMVARVVIPFGEFTTAAITEVIDTQGVTDAVIPIVFDIDVSRNVNLAPLSKELWETMEEFRDIKNKVFFGSLTPMAIELFR